MLESYRFSKKNIFYFDTTNKTIARFPSKSNLLAKGSDNSLYFGIKTNDKVCGIFCEFFNVKKVEQINGLNFDMECGDEIVNVVVNINKEGQIQAKIMKDGTMCRLTSNYSFEQMKEIDFTKYLLVLDFNNKSIRFKDPNDLFL